MNKFDLFGMSLPGFLVFLASIGPAVSILLMLIERGIPTPVVELGEKTLDCVLTKRGALFLITFLMGTLMFCPVKVFLFSFLLNFFVAVTLLFCASSMLSKDSGAG
jgi:hypothetical protein